MFTDKQIKALKYLMFKSRDGNDLVKRILVFLINSSKELTEQVSVSLMEDREGYSRDEVGEVGHGLHDMISSNGSTHLNELMTAVGTELHFSSHFGHYNERAIFETAGQFSGGYPMRYTFWLAKRSYGHSGVVTGLTASREILDKIAIRH